MVDRYDDVIARAHGPSGKSVSYEDYAAMEAERNALAAQVEALKALVPDTSAPGKPHPISIYGGEPTGSRP